MTAFELLKADHRKVEELFTQLESASGARKLSVFNQIKTELELHTQLEEKIFYPALEEPEETHDLTLEAYEEHAMVKKLLGELSRARTANDEWEAKAKVLQENVEHHVEEEENELFPKADQALSDEELDELGRRMEAEKGRKQGGKKSSKKSAGKSKSASKAAKKSGSKKGGSKKSGSKKAGSKKSSKKASKRSSKTAGRSRTKKSAKKR
ncbi:MAG TPA: hemerythrin domain-containing protein [Pyrinomonadaceae bacterium]